MGSNSNQVRDFKSINYSLGFFSTRTPESRFDKKFLEGLDEAKILLNSFIEEMELFDLEPEKKIDKSEYNKKVFIVHGKDDKAKLELTRILEKDFKLDPIILHEKPDESKTIIEKFEKHSDVGYVFILLTPDDVGMEKKLYRKIISDPEKYRGYGLNFRARQNVIFEMGYFVGKLGRDRVCCLYTGDVELPSDIKGILYKPFNSSVRESYGDILKELKNAGYELII